MDTGVVAEAYLVPGQYIQARPAPLPTLPAAGSACPNMCLRCAARQSWLAAQLQRNSAAMISRHYI